MMIWKSGAKSSYGVIGTSFKLGIGHIHAHGPGHRGIHGILEINFDSGGLCGKAGNGSPIDGSGSTKIL
jgi:hypothetical protein